MTSFYGTCFNLKALLVFSMMHPTLWTQGQRRSQTEQHNISRIHTQSEGHNVSNRTIQSTHPITATSLHPQIAYGRVPLRRRLPIYSASNTKHLTSIDCLSGASFGLPESVNAVCGVNLATSPSLPPSPSVSKHLINVTSSGVCPPQ